MYVYCRIHVNYYMYVCAYVYSYLYTSECAYKNLCICRDKCLCAYVYIYTSWLMCVRVCMHVHPSACTCAHVYLHIRACLRLHLSASPRVINPARPFGFVVHASQLPPILYLSLSPLPPGDTSPLSLLNATLTLRVTDLFQKVSSPPPHPFTSYSPLLPSLTPLFIEN